MPAVRGSRASNSSTAAAVAAAAAATTTTTSNGTNTDLPIDPSLNDMNTSGMMIPPPGMQAGPPAGGQQMIMPSQAGSADDGDNRTRNAKAQRRHREKRKAHLKALEESVQLLTLQLEDARRQLAQSAYYNSQRPGGAPMSPQSKDFAQLQAENAYLRDENADLRRQLYSYRMNYGNPSTPAEGNKDGSAQGNGQQAPGNAAGGSNGQQSWEVKPDQGFVYGQSGGMSPRRSGDASVQSTAENGPSSASSSSGNYPPIEHFTPMHQRSRSRNMSQTASPAQGGPGASPYMNNEPRPIDSRYSATGIRQYDPPTPVFSAPHSVPRYDVPHHYTPRPGEESVSWPPESGPPPFSGYPLNFGENTAGEEWRAGDA